MKKSEFKLNHPVAIEDLSHMAGKTTHRLRGVTLELPYEKSKGCYYTTVELDDKSAQIVRSKIREYPLFRLKHYESD